MRTAVLLAMLLAPLTASPPLSAANPNAGRDIAAACANCHGTDGRSRGVIPALAGRDAGAIVRQVREFRDGTRTGTIMQQLAKGYTDEDIAAAAAYFAAQKPQ